MEAPKCKLCGERHYGMCMGDHPSVAQARTLKLGQKVEKPLAEAKTASKEPYDRNAYHRQYMRKWMRDHRAKAKAWP